MTRKKQNPGILQILHRFPAGAAIGQLFIDQRCGNAVLSPHCGIKKWNVRCTRLTFK